MKFLERLKPLALLALRVSVGIAFMTRGYPKLVSGAAHSVRIFTSLEISRYIADLVGILELFGGGLLVGGLFTRGAALLLAIEMGVVVARTGVPLGGIQAFRTHEMPLLLGAASFALATIGAGAISIDAFTFEFRGKASKRSKLKD
jgi:putative oxidoreductase